MSAPRVSVIMPLHNGEAFVEEALQSVCDQGLTELEILVVDDGSNDGGADRVRACGAPSTLLRQPHSGPAAARNRGIRAAQGAYLAFIDADDCWPEDRLAWQLALLDADPGLAVVQGQLEEMREQEGRWVATGAPLFANSLCTGLFRREVFNSVGCLDESLMYCEDVDWFLAARAAAIAIHREQRVAVRYRRHTGNLTNRRDLVRKYTLRVVAKHRRRLRDESS